MEKLKAFTHLFGLAVKIVVLGAIFVPTFVILLVLENSRDFRNPMRRSRRVR